MKSVGAANHPLDVSNVQKLDSIVLVTLTISYSLQTSFALKQMKKSQIVETRQQQHIMSEKEIMEESDCQFIVKLFKTFKVKSNFLMLLNLIQYPLV